MCVLVVPGVVVVVVKLLVELQSHLLARAEVEHGHLDVLGKVPCNRAPRVGRWAGGAAGSVRSCILDPLNTFLLRDNCIPIYI
jgi:hypothetical protein